MVPAPQSIQPLRQLQPLASSSRATPQATTPILMAPASRSDPKPQFQTKKEWIVPPRPKPGRKPAQLDPDSSKKAVNRASQRAFRERKQEYVAELEEKVRALEAGEGERSVFFQQQAIRATEECAGLRALVEELRGQLLANGRANERLGRGTRKIAFEEEQELPAKRRRTSTRKAMDAMDEDALSTSSTSPASSSTQATTPVEDPAGASGGEACCGLCSSDSSCFCADVGYSIDRSKTLDAMPLPVTAVPLRPLIPSTNAIPLPPRQASQRSSSTIWSLEPAVPIITITASCSGDPSTCPACADDPFGQAFCKSLSESVCSSNPCASCPSRNPAPTSSTKDPIAMMNEQTLFASLIDLPCCGDPGLCGSLTCGDPIAEGPNTTSLPLSVPIGVRSATGSTVPCNEAWTALKCHPNIAFANLQMLADVVAKRTRCDGPTIIEGGGGLVPSIKSEEDMSPPLRMGTAKVERPRLVEQGVLERTGGKRLTVDRDAVKEALDILDRAVGRGQ